MIGAIIFIFCIPYIIFTVIALLIMLSNKISRTLSIAKGNTIRNNQLEKQNILKKEEKQKAEKWINDLRNGKQVTLGESVIQCENNTFIINGRTYLVNEIRELEFTYEILGVLEKTIDSYISDRPLPVTHYVDGYGYQYSDWQDNFGKITNTERMTLEEYHKKLKSMFYFHEYGDEHFFKNHQYEFEMEYYLSVILNNGIKENYLIGSGYSKSEKYGEETEKLREMIKQVKNYISKSEEEKQNLLQLVNNLKNGNLARIGKATIQLKNNTLIINENSVLVKKIQKLEFTEKVLSVWKNTLDTNQYKADDYFVENPNFGKTIQREKITLEQYNFERKLTLATAEEALKSNKVSTDILKCNYEFENGYYLSITLNDGEQKNYLIGNSINHYEENEKLKENLKEMINEVKFTLF